MSESSLLTLARSQEFESLERAWQDSLSDPGDVATYSEALKTLCDSDSLSVALKLGSQVVDTLADGGRRADAISLCTTLVKAGALSEGLARRLFDLIEQEYGSTDWYSLAIEMSGISPANLTNDAFARFDRVRHYTVGNVLYHRAGWGEGVIEDFDSTNRELTVRFANGRSQEFPLSSALDSLRPLPADDLRSMRLQAKEQLEELAANEPAVLIRKAVQLYRGQATSTQVKSELSPSVIPQKKWATFWKKAKTAAAHDPWLQIEGSSTRPTFVLRKRPLSLGEEAQRTMQHVNDLGEAIAVCRDYFARGLDDSAKDIIVELAREKVEAGIEKGNESHAHLLDGILFLEEHQSHASMSAAEEVKNLLSVGEEGKFDIRALDDLETQKSKEHAVRLLPQAFGDEWAQLCIDSITKCPATVLEAVIDELHEKKRAAALVNVWEKVAPYPRRHPVLLFHLGRLYAEGVFDSEPAKPDVITIGRVMMTLARTTSAERKGDPMQNRIRSRLTSLLTGRRALLERCFENIDRDNLAQYLQITERAGEDFPQEITDATLRAVANKFPDLTSKPEPPFWEAKDAIYVTEPGLLRQKEEYRVIVDEKIPANSKAIGNAAALGDLSENSEWEAAMEEQRNLTGRAQEMDTQLRMARLIEDVEFDGSVVAPGTRFTFSDLDSGERTTYRLLGPWDCIEDDILNYRAPIAKAFLGKAPGDEGHFDSPEGERHFRIDEVEKIV